MIKGRRLCPGCGGLSLRLPLCSEASPFMGFIVRGRCLQLLWSGLALPMSAGKEGSAGGAHPCFWIYPRLTLAFSINI